MLLVSIGCVDRISPVSDWPTLPPNKQQPQRSAFSQPLLLAPDLTVRPLDRSLSWSQEPIVPRSKDQGPPGSLKAQPMDAPVATKQSGAKDASAACQVCQAVAKDKLKGATGHKDASIKATPGKENALPDVVVVAVDKPTLVLDLDETLVHTSTLPIPGFDFVLSEGRDEQYFVKLRPFVLKFLRRMAELYHVVLFTASKRGYAERVVQRLDPQGTIFTRVLHRRSCTVVGHGQFSKDLSQLGVGLGRVALVDNQLASFLHQPANGIPIRSFMGDARDRELLLLLPFLEKLAGEQDLRPSIARKFPATARLAANHARIFPFFRRNAAAAAGGRT